MARHADDPNYNPEDIDNSQIQVQNQEAAPEVGAVASEPVVEPQEAKKPREKPDSYTVEKGDTLVSVASRFKMSPRYLQRINELKDPNALRVGDILRLKKN